MDNPINAAEAYSSDPQRRADYIAGFHAGQRAQTARLFSQAREKVQPIIETEKANEGMPGDSNAHPMTTPTQAERLAGLEGIISELLGLTMQDHMGLAYWMLSNRATLVYQLKEHQKALRQLAAAKRECEAVKHLEVLITRAEQAESALRRAREALVILLGTKTCDCAKLSGSNLHVGCAICVARAALSEMDKSAPLCPPPSSGQ